MGNGGITDPDAKYITDDQSPEAIASRNAGYNSDWKAAPHNRPKCPTYLGSKCDSPVSCKTAGRCLGHN